MWSHMALTDPGVRLHEQTNWTSGTRTNKVTETKASAVRYAIQREISIKFWCIK